MCDRQTQARSSRATLSVLTLWTVSGQQLWHTPCPTGSMSAAGHAASVDSRFASQEVRGVGWSRGKSRDYLTGISLECCRKDDLQASSVRHKATPIIARSDDGSSRSVAGCGDEWLCARNRKAAFSRRRFFSARGFATSEIRPDLLRPNDASCYGVYTFEMEFSQSAASATICTRTRQAVRMARMASVRDLPSSRITDGVLSRPSQAKRRAACFSRESAAGTTQALILRSYHVRPLRPQKGSVCGIIVCARGAHTLNRRREPVQRHAHRRAAWLV